MSIADCLFPPPVQNILRVVYATPDKSFMLKDLIERAGTGRGNGQRHVELLLAAGVLKEGPRQGRQRTISANTKFPLYPELQSICRKSFGLIEPIRDALRPFEEEIGEAFVFGSVARGADTHQSDIDLMVVGTAPMMEVMETLAKAEEVLGRPVHLNMYTPEEWADLRVHDPVVSHISTDSIVRILPNAETA
ncbi:MULTISPECIES: nucleotidyltransferase domain-containing protein [Noviherbaspirillum]|uniref:DNA polymerase III subunit beta n=1 Tax=Noviherbaspirillum autotrophicum TaxID=709839 RepID=A0A0C1Y959_9BURK|nr:MULTISPECIES: nucleotidyltransferase domain-containing protein [Noviherbaspirillum]KIF83473.1 DNA polymerase III subunit beta [Noviherbaspirillum autotrophicum]QDZ28696.1 nucleotidyltransferase domain-containing protein [Noviherbaspirillum sp. UKPF54]